MSPLLFTKPSAMQLTPCLKTEDISKLKGQNANCELYTQVVEGPITLLKEDGSLLLKIVRGEMADIPKAYSILESIKLTPQNRPSAAGASRGNGYVPMQRADGTLSNTLRVAPELIRGKYSGIIGYYDRYTRIPYARATSWMMNHIEQWQELQPWIQSIDAAFAKHSPHRHAIQKACARAVNPNWIIGSTAFSTITVNQNMPMSLHYDKGDLKEGLGCMAVLKAGEFDGGYLVIPRYGVAAKLQSGDIVLFDVHELHGNTPITKGKPPYRRITCVFYLRENLLRCGSPEVEQQMAGQLVDRHSLYSEAEIQLGEQRKQEAIASVTMASRHS